MKKRTHVPSLIKEEIFKDYVEDYKGFLSKNLNDAPSKIGEWIELNLIMETAHEGIGDKKLAFFAAEKSLLKDLMISECSPENLQKTYILIYQFIQYRHSPTFFRELDVFTTLINENRDFFREHCLDYIDSFKEILSMFEDAQTTINTPEAEYALINTKTLIGEVLYHTNEHYDME